MWYISAESALKCQLWNIKAHITADTTETTTAPLQLLSIWTICDHLY